MADVKWSDGTIVAAGTLDYTEQTVIIQGGVSKRMSLSALQVMPQFTAASIYGGSTSGGNLLLYATSHATLGSIYAQSGINSFNGDQTFTARPRANFAFNSTYTLNFAGASIGGGAFVNQTTAGGCVNMSPDVIFAQSGNTFSFIGFRCQPVHRNSTGVPVTIGATPTFYTAPTVKADAAAVTWAATADFGSSFVTATTGGGTLTAPNDYVNFEGQMVVSDAGVNISGTYACFAMVAPAVTGGTLAQVYGLRIAAHSAGSTFSYGVDVQALTGPGANYGVRIAKPSGGTVNVGLWNNGTTVYVPTGKTITATTDTIPHDASVIQLNNTSGSSKTLASTPTITDGITGEQVTILNIGASDVVLQDQGTLAGSNLRLAATTRTLSTRDSITLQYSATIGDWVEIAFTNVL